VVRESAQVFDRVDVSEQLRPAGRPIELEGPELKAGSSGNATDAAIRPNKSLNPFLFSSLCKGLVKSRLNRFQISGIWLQAHFEIIEDRLLLRFGCGDFLELHVAQHDLVAPDRR
jgi:hypothetical protein